MTEVKDSTQATDDTTERHGHCLCGGVKITARAASNHVGACHCTMCRRWGGGPLMEIDCGTDVVIGRRGACHCLRLVTLGGAGLL